MTLAIQRLLLGAYLMCGAIAASPKPFPIGLLGVLGLCLWIWGTLALLDELLLREVYG